MIAEARAHVAAALTAAGVPCAAYPPATISTPTALLYPGDPYVEATQLRASTIGLRLRLVSTGTGPHAARIFDTHLDVALAALHAAGVTVREVPPTRVADDGDLHTDIPVTVTWED